MTKRQYRDEERFARALADALAKRKLGQAVAMHVSGSVGDGTAPDIVFVPSEGPNAETTFVIETKMFEGEHVPDQVFAAAALDKDFIEAANEGREIVFALYVSGSPTDAQQRWAADHNIELYFGSKTSEQVAEEVWRRVHATAIAGRDESGEQ